MCYHPLKLVNPKLRSDNPEVKFDKNHDKIFIEAPCGECGECKQQRMNDFFVRTYQEYASTIAKGGYVFFDTFTYDEENVPKYMDLLCFDYEDYKQFIKNLRSKIYNRFKSYKFLKVFFVCEYGSETARSHYHCLFFVQDKRLDFQLLDELINSTWTKGFTQTNNPHDSHGQPNKYYKHPELCLVTKNDAINYVSKYVCKDFDFLVVLNKQKSAPKFKSWLQEQIYRDYIHSQLLNTEIDERIDILIENIINAPILADKYNVPTLVEFNYTHPLRDISYHTLFRYMSRIDYQRFLPFTRYSQAYGVDLTNVDLDQLMKGFVYLSDKEQGIKKYKLPMYVDRKMFYDYDKETRCYVLNDLGRKMKKVRLEHNAQQLEEKLPEFFAHWKDLCQNDNITSIILERAKIEIDSSIESPEDLDMCVEYLLDGRTWSEYVNYISIYKSLCIPKDPGDVQSGNFSILNYDLIQDNIPDFIDKTHVPYHDTKRFGWYVNSLLQCSCGECHPDFYNFDKLNDLYNIIREEISNKKQKDYLDSQKLKSSIKYHNIRYFGKL